MTENERAAILTIARGVEYLIEARRYEVEAEGRREASRHLIELRDAILVIAARPGR